MAATDKPFIRFTHSKKLRVQTLKVLNAIDKAKDPTPQREALATLVMDLAEAGMQSYFLDSIRRIGMGMIIEQGSNLGVMSILRILGPMVRNIIGHMDARQLKETSKIIREMLD